MNNLLDCLQTPSQIPFTHYRFSIGKSNSPQGVIVTGVGRRHIAKSLKQRFGERVVVLDGEALESQQIDQAVAAGMDLIGTIKTPPQGYTSSDTTGVLLDTIKDEITKEDIDAIDRERTVVMVDEGHIETSSDEEGPGRPEPVSSSDVDNAQNKETVLVYGSVESFIEDFSKMASLASLEDNTSVTAKVDVTGLTAVPCTHGFDKNVMDCEICVANLKNNEQMVAPILTEEGEIIPVSQDRAEDLPVDNPSIATPEEAGQLIFDDGEDASQTVIVPADIVIFSDGPQED